MRSLLRALLPPLLLIAACADDPSSDPSAIPARPAPAPTTPDRDFVAGEVIVKLHHAIDGTAAVDVAGERLMPVTRLPSGAWLMRLDDQARRAPSVDALEVATLDAVDALRADGAVEFAYENVRFEFSYTPNDPLFPQQWQYPATRVPQAWDRTTGSSQVRIALIDTGRREHPDLAGSWLPGWDFIQNDADPTDTGTWAHGIHVGGIAAARMNNGFGGTGICPNCRLVPLRVTPTMAQVEQAVAWAAGPDFEPVRAEIINMSLNHPTITNCNTYPGLRDAITRATSRGVSVVVSAGNQGYATGPTVPATCPGAIAVASSTPAGLLASYSNRGPGIDLVAPGGGLTNEDPSHGFYGAGIGCPTDPNPNDPYNGTVGALSTWSIGSSHCFRYLSGTSMAAPHVAGIIALMRTVRPTIQPAEIEQILAATANPNGVACPAGACGAGLVVADAAVHAAQFGLGPELSVTPTSVAFGTQPLGTTSTIRTVNLFNSGAGNLTYTVSIAGAFNLDCLGSCSGNLAPGFSRQVQVSFTPAVHGFQSGSLIIESNDADESPFYVSLRGDGITPIASLGPAALAFGSVQVGTSSAPQQFTLFNAPDATMSLIFSASPSSSEFPLDCGGGCNGVLLPGASRTMTVSFNPAVTGHRSGLIHVNTNDLMLTYIPVTLSGTGTAPGIAVSPTPLAFGDALVGTPTARTVTMTNTGTAPLVVTGASVPPGFTVTGLIGFPIPANSSSSLIVTCTRASVGWFSGDLVLTHNAGAEVRVPMTCGSPGGRLELIVPASGELLLRPYEQGLVRVRNSGPASLELAALGFSGGVNTWWTVSGINLPQTLPPGGYTEWLVSCSPQARSGTYWEKHAAKHDGLDPGGLMVVGCQTGPFEQLPEPPGPVDPPQDQ